MAATDGQPGSNGCSIDWDAEIALHRGWLRTVIYARLGEPSAVDDVLQDVSLAAIGTPAGSATSVVVPAWLYRVAVRQALLHRRRMGRERRRLKRYAVRHELRNGKPTTDDPLGWLLADERTALVRQALGKLTSRERELLLLKYTENWSYRELAERLNISESALEARLHRARHRLRDLLTRQRLHEHD
jgi:RNA polymerase sigma-70 factor (ECF subfamily)